MSCVSCQLDEIINLLQGGSDEVNCWRTPEWATVLINNQERLQKGMDKIMALVSVEQTELDTLATDLSAAVASVGSELADLEAQLAAAGNPLPAGSLDGVKSALTALQGLEVPVPPPVP